jgi:hypothetical protein
MKNGFVNAFKNQKLSAHLPIAIGFHQHIQKYQHISTFINQHIRLQIPHAGAATLDHVFDSQNKRHVDVNNERRAKCDEGCVNKEKSDLR